MLVTVSQLNNYIRGVVDTDSTLSNIEVSGEVTGAKLSHGYWFFAIKDDYSQFDCFAFSDKISTVTNGMQVIVSGNIGFLPKSGRLSLTVYKITEISQGASYLQYIELKDKLNKLGLFDISRKKALPYMPTNVGIITSQTGAVIRDITEVIGRRQPFIDMLLYPVKVQGDGATDEIISALTYMSQSNVEVVILARGGGSNEDLAVFNDEGVVLALANCTKPTVSAIGHGVDYTLCDMVADVRAITPTEAGELITIDSNRLISDIETLMIDMFDNINSKILYAEQSVVSGAKNIVAMYDNKISLTKMGIMAKIDAMYTSVNGRVDNQIANVRLVSNDIQSNNPARLAQRGFRAIFSNGKLVEYNSPLVVGQGIQIFMEDGSVVNATITSIDEKQSKR